jgi:DMATS type aromatic prenyltransferase
MVGTASFYLREHVNEQLRALCEVVGLPDRGPLGTVGALLAPIGGSPLNEPAPWPTGVSDDHTPVEFSVACDVGKPPTLRVLGETVAAQPGRRTNLGCALNLLDVLSSRFNLALDRFRQLRQVFLDREPQHDFAMWFSMVHRQASVPQVKVYFNPETQGSHRAPHLVAEGLRRLGLDRAYSTMLRHAVRPGQLGGKDRFSFFAIDLHSRSDARVKVYVSHHDAGVAEAMSAASAVAGVDESAVRDFLTITGCTGPLTGRPLLSGYTFVEGDTDRPSSYSLYLPIRDYVGDDDEARELTLAVFKRFGLDTGLADRAIAAVAKRPLRDGVGLIAHLSLRLTSEGVAGVTIYLSSEAYQVAPPRVDAQSGSTPCR